MRLYKKYFNSLLFRSLSQESSSHSGWFLSTPCRESLSLLHLHLVELKQKKHDFLHLNKHLRCMIDKQIKSESTYPYEKNMTCINDLLTKLTQKISSRIRQMFWTCSSKCAAFVSSGLVADGFLASAAGVSWAWNFWFYRDPTRKKSYHVVSTRVTSKGPWKRQLNQMFMFDTASRLMVKKGTP